MTRRRPRSERLADLEAAAGMRTPRTARQLDQLAARLDRGDPAAVPLAADALRLVAAGYRRRGPRPAPTTLRLVKP